VRVTGRVFTAAVVAVLFFGTVRMLPAQFSKQVITTANPFTEWNHISMAVGDADNDGDAKSGIELRVDLANICH